MDSLWNPVAWGCVGLVSLFLIASVIGACIGTPDDDELDHPEC